MSFLGLGIQPPDPSWGSMLSEARTFMEQAPWMAVFPALFIIVTILLFNILGDSLRDVLDPKLKTVVMLRFFEDMKLEDIAAITGAPLSTVKSRLYKALKLLKVDLQGEVVTT